MEGVDKAEDIWRKFEETRRTKEGASDEEAEEYERNGVG